MQQQREIKALYAQRWTLSAIAQKVGVSPRTILRYRKQPDFPETLHRRPTFRRSLLDFYKPEVVARWNDGITDSEVLMAQQPWAVVTDTAPSIQIFALYGQRFGGIEPHFKDYKSAAFELPRSRISDAQALSRLLMLLAAATIIAISAAIELMTQGALHSIDWHAHRGLSFLQIGLRQIKQLCYQRLPMPPFTQLPRCNPPPAYASLKVREAMNNRIEFAKVTVF